MGGAPEVAAHLERMQPASAPAARLHRPAALAGALMKPSKHTPASYTILSHMQLSTNTALSTVVMHQ